jgi:hypothetical protein
MKAFVFCLLLICASVAFAGGHCNQNQNFRQNQNFHRQNFNGGGNNQLNAQFDRRGRLRSLNLN